MVLNAKFLKVVVVFIFLGFTIFGIAEGAGPKKNKVKITFRSPSHGNSNINNLKLNHPIKISQAEITNHLVLLRYKGTFIGDKEERVFSSPEVQRLAPILMKAFAGVGPEKTIRVRLKSVGGVTSGDIFSFKKYLNWRFDSIRGETFFQRNDIREWNIFAWKLIPQKGQLYFKSKSDKRIHKNWIISNLKLPVADQENTDDSVFPDALKTKSSNNNISPKLAEKLKHLKYLHDKKLISEDEYKAQQKKVFDELF